MRTIVLLWGTWRAVMAVLRGKALPFMLDYAERLEQHLEYYPPDRVTVTLYLADDVYVRSFNWARWQLGIPLSEELLGRGGRSRQPARRVQKLVTGVHLVDVGYD